MSCDRSGVSDARRRMRYQTIQGVDYVEVLDFAAPAAIEGETVTPSLRWRILLLHCFLPAGDATKANIEIQTKPGNAPLRLEWAFAARRFLEPALASETRVSDDHGNTRPLTQEEKQYFHDLPDGANILVAHISHVIDPTENMAVYVLRSAMGAGSDDPRLATYEFTLHAEGPVDFDCAPEAPQSVTLSPSPPIDYLAKDYASFRQLMLDRMAVVMPEWADRNAADIGIALIELLAYVGDQLSYYQDAAASEAYLGTARRRISVRRHARLLDYALHEGNNARAWICLQVGDGFSEPLPGQDTSQDPEVLPAGIQLITKFGNQDRITLERDAIPEALLENAIFFETMAPVRPSPRRNCIAIYDWMGEVECLQRGATKATLDIAPDTLAIGDVLVFEEVDDEARDSDSQGDSSHRHAVCVTSLRKVQDVIEGKTLTEITWHDDDALPFALHLRYPSGQKAAVVRGNVVLADHGRTVVEEPLLPDRVTAGERYRPRLAGLDVTHRVAPTAASTRLRSATAQLLQDPRKALPVAIVQEILEGNDAAMLAGNHEKILFWHPRRDLLASGPFDRHVALEVENDGSAHLRFGNNMYGREPSTRSRWQASYRVGNGRAGNIGAAAIAHIILPDNISLQTENLIRWHIESVRNPQPAVGGNQPERDEQARLYAPYAFRQGERAVTSDDYANITERHPEVQKAIAAIRWTGSWNTVFVTVDRRGGRPIDLEFEGEMRTFLEPFRMAGQDLEIQSPDFVALDVAFTVTVAPDQLRSEIHTALMDALGSGQTADGVRGFFHPDNFTFGDPVYLSSLLARAMEIPGVMRVNYGDDPPGRHRFQRLGEPPRGEVGAGVISVGPTQIIRVDNDPVAPHNGRLRLYMEGGL